MRVVDEESADALLQLNVISLEDRPFTYTTAEQTEQYRFAVLVAAELVKAGGWRGAVGVGRTRGMGNL